MFSYVTGELIQDLCFLRWVQQKKGGAIASFVRKVAEVKDKRPRLYKEGNEDVRGWTQESECPNKVETWCGRNEGYGMNCVPPNSFVKILPPVPQHVTAFRERFFKEVIKVK